MNECVGLDSAALLPLQPDVDLAGSAVVAVHLCGIPEVH